MNSLDTLETHLNQQVLTARVSQEIATTVLAIATAAQSISTLIARGRLAGDLGAERGDNSDGDTQKELDLVANEIILAALKDAPVAWIVSEELEQPAQGKSNAPLVVAIDPLDGSSNIDTNTAVGTIFSILPACDDVDAPVAASVLQPGSRQLAAGYIIYGPQTALVLTLGNGTLLFTLDREAGTFYLSDPAVQIPETTREFAINVSNFRHWDRPVRTYIDDCLNGEDGYRNDNYNMRWLASLVAECHRILSRGGVFLYPADARKGYSAGRLRLLYEVSPIAFLVEQAGGAATTGQQRLLEIEPASIHERAPMIFGSRREIARIERYFDASDAHAERSQLFNKRGLFRA
jgi:fructose-1,6-bisphosphatase I